MPQNYLIGLFDDDEVLLHAIKKIRKAGIQPLEALTPFPVHGLDHALGQKPTRLHTAGFVFGLAGFLTAIAGMYYITGLDWPMNVGGKPSVPLPSMVPITFELTVLFSAVGMVITFFIKNGLSVFRSPDLVIEPSTTDDKFGLLFDADRFKDEASLKELYNLLKDNGAIDVKEKSFK